MSFSKLQARGKVLYLNLDKALAIGPVVPVAEGKPLAEYMNTYKTFVEYGGETIYYVDNPLDEVLALIGAL